MTELAVVDGAAAPDLYVVFKVDGAEYALAASDVLQMESFSGATRVPGAPPFVAGILQIRGRVVPVVDLRVRFGLPPVTPTIDSRVVVALYDHRAVALLADSAREVLKIARSDLKSPPKLLEESGFVKAVAQLGPRTVMLIDFVKVIGEETLDVG